MDSAAVLHPTNSPFAAGDRSIDPYNPNIYRGRQMLITGSNRAGYLFCMPGQQGVGYDTSRAEILALLTSLDMPHDL